LSQPECALAELVIVDALSAGGASAWRNWAATLLTGSACRMSSQPYAGGEASDARLAWLGRPGTQIGAQYQT
jgi:hypothetical protein